MLIKSQYHLRKSDIKFKENEEEVNQLTEYGLPNEVIETHYGPIKRLEWQRLEVKRIGNCRIHKWCGLTAIVKGLK